MTRIERARAMVGIPFRPQGRNPSIGLDCVGLVLAVFKIPDAKVRRDYRLRGPHREELAIELGRLLRRRRGRGKPGDVLLCHLAGEQAHLAIHCGDSFVHADAKLRKVVETPGAPPWPIVGAFHGRRKSGAQG